MEEERRPETPVYDFTPDGCSPDRPHADAACDGWSAYASWLMSLKASYRCGPQAVLSVPEFGQVPSKILGGQAGGSTHS